jgi:hypothetical protein
MNESLLLWPMRASKALRAPILAGLFWCHVNRLHANENDSAGKIVEKCFSQFESRAAELGHDDSQSHPRVTDLELATHLTNESHEIAPDSAAQIGAHTLRDPLHKIRGRARARLDDLEKVEIEALELLDVFQLPPKSLCDELVQLYFDWVAPLIPLINRAQFMEQYNSTENPPSLLLLQAILLAGSKAHDDLGSFESDGLPSPIMRQIYRRAKALYGANIEDDPVTTVQALTVMGWYCGDIGDTTENSEHWARIAMIKAQANGMHQAVEKTRLSSAEKTLRKRIWWTLFTLERSIAMNRRRPALLYTAHCDIEPIVLEDFIESGEKTSMDPIHALFSLQYIGLHSIIDKILSPQYRPQTQSNGDNNITTCDTALNHWLQNCPSELRWESASHNFWSALLQTRYNATLCFLHGTKLNTGHAKRELSLVTARSAMSRIAAIAAGLHANKELQKCPASFVDDLLRSLLTFIIDARINGPQKTWHERAKICLGILKELSGVWVIPKKQYTMLESAIQKYTPRDILNSEHGVLAQQTYREKACSIRRDPWTPGYNDRTPHSVPATVQSLGQHTEDWANFEQSNSRLPQPSQDPNILFSYDTVLQPIQNPRQMPQIIQEPLSPWSWFDINGCGLSQLGMFEALQGGNGTDAGCDITDAHYSAACTPNQLVPFSEANIFY